MKRLLAVFALLGAALFLMASQGDHKVDWCHFPPGLWTGERATSKVLILSIDVAADGSIGPAHQNHQGDGPVCVGEPDPLAGHDCSPVPVKDINNPGQFLAPLGADCLGNTCGTAWTQNPTSPHHWDQQVNLVAPDCVCPAGTGLAGSQPVDTTVDPTGVNGSPNGKSCGAHG